jgi:outer membrane lipoprotein-sorting protein
MSVTSTHPAIRWAVPGAIVAIALGATALTAISADATSTLPPRSAAELLVDVQTASLTSISGTVVQNADLGLPDLSQLAPGDSSDFTSLISGSHTLRVWYAGEDQQRLALLGTLGESDIVRNGTDLWTWSSETNAATHYQLPEREQGDAAVPDAGALAITPQQAAEQALAAIDPSTAVTVDGTPSVAGRDAYELVLTPRDSRSLVGEIRIAVDAEQHIPLRVQVWAAGAGTPAFEVGFTQVSFETPGAEQFQFTPPPGATVTESTLEESDRAELPGAPAPDLDAAVVDLDPTGEPTVVGTGWTTVLVATLPQQAGTGSAPEAVPAPESGAPEGGPRGERPGSGIDLQSLVGSLPAVSGDWGSGHLLQSALFSVLVTDDGRVLGGAVAPELLYEAAAQ